MTTSLGSADVVPHRAEDPSAAEVARLRARGWETLDPGPTEVWTDDFANVLGATLHPAQAIGVASGLVVVSAAAALGWDRLQGGRP